MTHTPGPWSVGYTRLSHVSPELGEWPETAIHVGKASNRGNCLAVACMGGRGATDKSREAVEANARLIAAAPEMLEALEYVRNFGSQGEIDGGPHAGMSVSFFVENAIASAKTGSK
jgi:hypothetical protein